MITTNLVVNPIFQQTETISICSGQSYTFPDGTVLNNITSNVLHASHLISINNCDSVIETTLNVTTIDTTISVVNNVLTASMNNANYQWIDCTNNQNIVGATSQSFTPNQNGEYAVNISLNECAVSSNCVKVIGIAIQNVANELSNIIIYPNPNQGVFKILISEAQNEDIIYNIYDISGKLIKTDKIMAFETETILDIPNISAGQYIIKMITSQFNTSRQFIIVK